MTFFADVMLKDKYALHCAMEVHVDFTEQQHFVLICYSNTQSCANSEILNNNLFFCLLSVWNLWNNAAFIFCSH